MSGDWAWEQAHGQDRIISDDPTTARATLIPVILGSDKTTISVAMGQTDYYPLYLSIRNVSNTVCCAHCNAIVLITFLAMPKTMREHASTLAFHNFKRQLFHSLLTRILHSLACPMRVPETVFFGDNYYQHVIYAFAAYIADYEEQVLLSCIVCNWCPKCLAHCDNLDGDALRRSQEHCDIVVEEFDLHKLWDTYGIVSNIVPFTNDFPRADIHAMLSPDILHQLIKGGFKDHLVDWVERYLVHIHGKAEAERILDNINRHIAAVAPFTGLQCFPQGQHFKQWTGDDSKGLMKVYIVAIDGHVLKDMTLTEINDALQRFHLFREVFWNAGAVESFSLPQQHAMKHYHYLICQFGVLNGLCSSIMESKHIKAVKWPYQHTNCYQALGQMLLINQRLDKLAVVHMDFNECGSHTSQFNDEGHSIKEGQDVVDGGEERTASYEEEPGDALDDLMVVNAHVSLARKHHMFYLTHFSEVLTMPPQNVHVQTMLECW
ncbi:hypothetical protein EDD16DRAFT_1525814 [Pisolithus croceorrhizus]|nr:hypothetical protein EDD16DRAFT_1525814 [Pisolithus croceorrhizus]KAI6120236.1 hypothetical protein EV401DRAFT_1887741 [Pisolithus croceorrhizus]